MVGHLHVFLLKMDNVSKTSVTAKKLENANNIKTFQNFIHKTDSIWDWKFFINDGKLEYTFRGPEHRKILQTMDDMMICNRLQDRNWNWIPGFVLSHLHVYTLV